MQRFGSLIAVKPEREEEYKAFHARVWPGVLARIHECNISNYSIYLKDHMLFSYFEYIGEDYAADMAKMADDPLTQTWWAIMNPIQTPIPTRKEGEWWAIMEEVFHLD